ncbi:MAG: ATP-binding protein [Hylemonella sp.]|uniref:ATP-binding protein n=1 Tax=Hylemonella sp. TaxID=2066020 RepID=UPI00391C9F5C
MKIENHHQQSLPPAYPDLQSTIQLETPADRAAYTGKLDDSIGQLFGGDLEDKRSRQRLAMRHRMLDHRYVLDTEEIENFWDIVYDWVGNRKSGLYAYGLHRQGKTTAMNEVIQYLRDDFPFVAVLHCVGERNPHQTKKNFCLYLLSEFGYPIGQIGRNVRPETLLANLLMTACARAGGRQCVLFIDEAQLFSVTQYRYLLEIWNEMHRKGFLFGTVLIGQPDLRLLKELTSESDHGAVVSRFFVKEYGFGGVKNVEMLTKLLAQFDSRLVYPEGSCWPYSRFFIREGFDHGWRLEQEAPLLWEALCRVTHEKKSAIKTSGFRMAWIIDAVHSFLVDGMSQDSKRFRGTIDTWEECIMSGTEAELLL